MTRSSLPLSAPKGPGLFEVTVLLRRWDEQRDREALDEALPHLLDRLGQLARYYLARERPGHVLEPTALVNEVYLRLLESRIGKIESCSQFFAFAARLMRQILVDYARGRLTTKRGGNLVKVELEDVLAVPERQDLDADQVLTVHQALGKLKKSAPLQCKIVELRYFVGLSVDETSQVLRVSAPTVERGWSAARRWLAREMQHEVSSIAV